MVQKEVQPEDGRSLANSMNWQMSMSGTQVEKK